MAGNLSHSMRENYETHGVEKYYNLVASSYRNPHFPGVQKCLNAWLDKWWTRESPARGTAVPLYVWDLAAGSGEVTEATMRWYHLRRTNPEGAAESSPPDQASILGESTSPPIPVRKPVRRPEVTLDSSIPDPVILASDPFTAPAYTARTSRPCAPLSFADVADGQVPEVPSIWNHDVAAGDAAAQEAGSEGAQQLPVIDMVVSSFALHLCTPSELFALLYELSTKSRWLVVLAPHKKPEIKPGWGWIRWNIAKWEEANSDHEVEGNVEIVIERVRLRVWKSLNT